MKKYRGNSRWFHTEELCSSFSFLSSKLNRLMILDCVWTKETGQMAGQWELYAVKGSTIFVKSKSSIAAQELLMKSPVLIKSLNKYFSSAWIRKIKNI